MSENVLSKEVYLDQLAEAAAKRIAQGTTPATVAMMVPVWKEIIVKEMSPILELIN